MFGASFGPTDIFVCAKHRRTFRVRSVAYAHSGKLHRSVQKVKSWTRFADVDSGISKRSRAKRAARAQEISEWIEARENGAVLALIEANHSVVMGCLMLAMSMIACIADLAQGGAEPFLKQLPLALGVALLGSIGVATASIGGQIRRVVNKHPKGLAGLHRNT